MKDMLTQLFQMQKVIIEKVPHGLREESIPFLEAILGLQQELVEFTDLVSWKKWRRNKWDEDKAKAKDEIVDLWHYLLELTILCGFSPEEMVERFKSKHEVNLQRYEAVSKGDFSWDDKPGGQL